MWIFLATVFIQSVCSRTSFGDEKPNIVFLFADDQRADTIGAHGNPHIETPNLDALARTGFSFRRNYCAGSYSGAVCVASRAMLMTGRFWKHIESPQGSKNWDGMPLLPEILADQGAYETHIVGKWHNGKSNLSRAFQSGSAVYMGGMANHAALSIQDFDGEELTEKRSAGGFSSQVFADAAIDYLQNHPSDDKPFFLYVAFTAPHDPRNPPLAYRQRYYESPPPLPQNFLPQHPFNNAAQTTGGRDESLAAWPRDPKQIQDQLCEYYGLITHLDEQVGRILACLEKQGLADNTLVVYTADHGLAMGSHGLLGKQNVYEQSMRCPLIIRGPNVPAGKSTESFSYIHDLYATICNAANVEVPPDTDSKDLTPLWTGSESAIHDFVYLPFQDNQRALNDGRWKLHVYPQINHRLLFDLQTDPHETNNLAGQARVREEEKRLDQLLKTARELVGDSDPLLSNMPQPKEVTYDNSQRVRDKWQPDWIRSKYFEPLEASQPTSNDK